MVMHPITEVGTTHQSKPLVYAVADPEVTGGIWAFYVLFCSTFSFTGHFK